MGVGVCQCVHVNEGLITTEEEKKAPLTHHLQPYMYLCGGNSRHGVIEMVSVVIGVVVVVGQVVVGILKCRIYPQKIPFTSIQCLHGAFSTNLFAILNTSVPTAELAR